jgi:hypothetical protein
VRTGGTEGSGGLWAPDGAYLRRPPGWLFYGLLAACAGLLVYDVSGPGGGFVFALLAALGLVLGAVVWLVRLLAYWRASRSGNRVRSADAVRLVLCPLALLALWGLVSADVPLEARWALSRGGFDDVADGPVPADRSRRVGLYQVDRVEQEGAGVTFWVSGAGGMFGGAGFSYLPNGPWAATVDRDYQHLGGRWYWWAHVARPGPEAPWPRRRRRPGRPAVACAP